MILLSRVEIPNYIKRVPLSKSSRAKYYTQGDKIPKKYSSDQYIFKGKYLINKDTKDRVVKRAASGTAKMHTIRGQEIWRGINYHIRSKVASELKKYLYEQTSEVPSLMDELIYPLSIRIDFYDNVYEGEDLDNMVYFYRKSLHDALSGNVLFDKIDSGTDKKGKSVYQMVPNRELYPPKIIDDDKLHVQDIPTRFHPIKEGEIPKMVIEICSLRDEEE